MIILIRKRHLALLGGLFCSLLALTALTRAGEGTSLSAFSPETPAPATVIVDAGHGGEDGGAVAGDGTVESRLNLAIALRLEELLRFAGVDTALVRREDVSIYSPGAETLRQKKVSDLQNRVALVNGTENALLVSIHQNSLPSSPATHGAQVFWNGVEGAETLGGAIQDRLNLAVNPGNEKAAKRIPDSIYLMKHIMAPGVIVECGFLSNGGETARLGEAAYQERLAAAIAAGCLEYLNEGEGP